MLNNRLAPSLTLFVGLPVLTTILATLLLFFILVLTERQVSTTLSLLADTLLYCAVSGLGMAILAFLAGAGLLLVKRLPSALHGAGWLFVLGVVMSLPVSYGLLVGFGDTKPWQGVAMVVLTNAIYFGTSLEAAYWLLAKWRLYPCDDG